MGAGPLLLAPTLHPPPRPGCGGVVSLTARLGESRQGLKVEVGGPEGGGGHLLGVRLCWAGSWAPGGGGWANAGAAPGRLVAFRTASSKSSIHLWLSRSRGRVVKPGPGHASADPPRGVCSPPCYALGLALPVCSVFKQPLTGIKTHR